MAVTVSGLTAERINELIAGLQTVTPERTTFAVASKNLANPTEFQAGYVLVVGTGATTASASYTTTGYIPVTAGQAYTISNPRNVALYNTDKVYVGSATGWWDNPTSAALTITPAVSGYIRAGFLTASYNANFQVEKGSAATAYTSHGFTMPSLLLPVLDNMGLVTVTKTGTALSISSLLGSDTLIFQATTQRTTTNNGFNLDSVNLAGTQITSANDEVTPIRTQDGTVGGNHAFSMTRSFANPDSKTSADLGSVWTDGTRQYVLMGFSGTGKLIFGGDYTRDGSGIATSAAVAPTADLTHVSGATQTGTVLASTIAVENLLPTTRRVQVQVFADGKPVTTNGTLKVTSVQVRETYEVYDYSAIYDAMKANIGVAHTALTTTALGLVRVVNRFKFTAAGRVQVRTELTALKPTRFGACGFLQSAAMTSTGGSVIRYVPGVNPISGIDFGAGVDLSTYSSNLLVTTSDLIDATVPPIFSLDRVVKSSATAYGFVMGYLPFAGVDTDNAARIAGTPTNLWDLRGTDKSYPNAINNKLVAAGGRVVSEGYRSFLTAAQTDAIRDAGTNALRAFDILETVAGVSGIGA